MKLFQNWIQLLLLFGVVFIEVCNVDTIAADNNANNSKVHNFKSKGPRNFNTTYNFPPPHSINPIAEPLGPKQVLELEICNSSGGPGTPFVVYENEFIQFCNCLSDNSSTRCFFGPGQNGDTKLPPYDNYLDPDDNCFLPCRIFQKRFVTCIEWISFVEINILENFTQFCQQNNGCGTLPDIFIPTKILFVVKYIDPSIKCCFSFQDNSTCNVSRLSQITDSCTTTPTSYSTATVRSPAFVNNKSTTNETISHFTSTMNTSAVVNKIANSKSTTKTLSHFTSTNKTSAFVNNISHITIATYSNFISTVKTSTFVNDISRSTIKTVSENENPVTPIVIGVITSCGIIILIIVVILFVIRLRRRKFQETDNGSSSNSDNSSCWSRRNHSGGVKIESNTVKPGVHVKRNVLPRIEFRPASLATNPISASENRNAHISTEIRSNCSRGGSLNNGHDTLGHNTYVSIDEISRIGNDYTTLDELTKYSHLYQDLTIRNPNLRPAMPLPPHVINQTNTYYSVAQPTSIRPTNQNIDSVTPQYIELLDDRYIRNQPISLTDWASSLSSAQPTSNHSTNQNTDSVNPPYIELLPDNVVINQPISASDYIIPLSIPPMMYENTSAPNTYISLISTND